LASVGESKAKRPASFAPNFVVGWTGKYRKQDRPSIPRDNRVIPKQALAFVTANGVVLESARGSAPRLAEAVVRTAVD